MDLTSRLGIWSSGGVPLDYGGLKLVAKEANSTVSLTTVGSPDACYFEYSLDGGRHWTQYTIGSVVTLARANDEMFFRATSAGNVTLSTGTANCHIFVLSGDIKAAGDLRSVYSQAYGDVHEINGSCRIFSECTALTDASEVILGEDGDEIVGNYGMAQLFRESGIVESPVIPNFTLTGGAALSSAFGGCVNLETAGRVRVKNVPVSLGLGSLFNGCAKLVSTPEMDVKTATAPSALSNMFAECTSLTRATLPPIVSLGSNSALSQMFRGCTSLQTVEGSFPSALATGCFRYMFRDCTSLVTVPSVLPATTAASQAYQYMFMNCSNLEIPPEIMLSSLGSSNCVQHMFDGCTKLKELKVHFTEWGTSMTDWVKGVNGSGVFHKPNALSTVYGTTRIPVNFTTRSNDYGGLKITALQAGSTVGIKAVGTPPNVTIQTSSDGTTWTDYTIGDEITLDSVGSFLYFRAGHGGNAALASSTVNYHSFFGTGRLAMTGNISSLLDPALDMTSVPDYGFTKLFYEFNALVSTPDIEFDSVGAGGLVNLFMSCSGLESIGKIKISSAASTSLLNFLNSCTSLTSVSIDLPKVMVVGFLKGCSSLSDITVTWTSWGTTIQTSNWVSGVSATGTFRKPSALPTEFGVSRIPSGWTVVNTD